MNNISTQFSRGHVVIGNVLIFIALSLFMITALLGPLVSTYKTIRAFTNSQIAHGYSVSGMEEALYRLNNNKPLATGMQINLDDHTITLSRSNASGGITIATDVNVNGFLKTYEVQTGHVISLQQSYGVHAGVGGLEMHDQSRIEGDAYSNGEITGSFSSITGSAFSANTVVLEELLSTVLINPEASEIVFAENGGYGDLAQSFQVASLLPVTSGQVYIKKSAHNDIFDISVKIVSDDLGEPGSNIIAETTIASSSVATSFAYIPFFFGEEITLTPGVTYWIVFDGVPSENVYTAGAHSEYITGETLEGVFGGAWNDITPPSDLSLKLFTGTDFGRIEGITVEGDAHSHTLDNTTVLGDALCIISINSKACDRAPAYLHEVPFVIRDDMVSTWKSSSETGTTTGSVVLQDAEVVTMGPQKIEGNLTVTGGATLILTGTVWVSGNITVNGGASVTLDSAFSDQSSVLLADGIINVSGGGSFSGSGNEKSYIVVLSTSDCDDSVCSSNAIELRGGSSSVVVVANEGTANLSGGVTAHHVSANKVELDGNSTVVYENNLQDIIIPYEESEIISIREWNEK